MRGIAIQSWGDLMQAAIGIALFALIGMGIRLLFMMTLQARRERMNRQINERLRVLIAAYKTLGGSFTGRLTVDPTHLREQRLRAAEAGEAAEEGSDRARRIRDAVEAALSDILLLGTEQQVRLAEQAARDMVAGRPVEVGPLVISLRDFIRSALDLAPVPAGLAIPPQGPARPSSSAGGSRGKGEGEGRKGGGGGGGMGGMAAGGGMGMGMGMGMGAAGSGTDPADQG